MISILLLSFSMLSSAETTLEKVSLQLNWKYQFQFAGFIAAKEKGFYQQVGLDVELIEYQNGIDIVDDVLQQKTHFGIHHSSITVKDHKIIPNKLLATYFQQSPYVLATSDSIKTPHDLRGKRIMLPKQNLTDTAIGLMLAHFYLTPQNTTFILPSFNIQDLIEHKVDAAAIFTTNELFMLEQEGFNYNLIEPATYGYATTSVNLFTSPSEALHHPQRTQDFVKASTKGWEYALAHQQEIIALIVDKYSRKKSIAALQFEAVESQKLMQTEAIAVGSINHVSRLKLLKQLKRSGLLDEDQQLPDSITPTLFTLEQEGYLHTKKEITMCVDPEWMPFEQIKNDQHIGIAGEVFSYFKSQLPIPIRLINTQNWKESVDKAKNRECDILSLAAETPSRIKYMDFTRSYIDLPVVLATRNDTFFIDNISEVKDKKLGVVKGYAMIEFLRERIPGINIIEVDSISDGLERVENGELFGYIDNLMTIAYSIQKGFTNTLKVSARLPDRVKLAVATRNDQPQLNEVFEVLVNTLSEAQLQTFYNHWVTVKQELGVDYRILWVLLTLVVLSVIVFISRLKILNATLSKQSRLIEQERERFRILFDKSANGLLLIDNGKFIDCNNKAAQILGYDSKQELIQKTAAEDLSPEFQPDGQLSSQKCIETTESCFRDGYCHFEWLHNTKQGSEVLVDVTLTRLDYLGKKIIHVTWRDLTEQKKHEQALIKATKEAQRANDAKSEFLANISHELRTPMHAILSFANIGIKNSESGSRESLVRYFSNIRVSGDRLLILLNNLLDLSKLEANKVEISKNHADLVSVFYSCELEQQQQMLDLGLTLKINEPDEPIDVQFDPVPIGQVMTNLLSNAIKFSPENSLLTVTIGTNKKHELLFSLKDKGIGIPNSELEDVFDAFIQSSQTKTGSGGTGLGLAISRKIIEAHGGRIWAENNTDGTGVTFSFSIP